MSLLLVSNDINHHGNLKGKSRVARQVKIVNHASHCNVQSRLKRLILGPITYLDPITRHGKPL